MNPKYYIRKIYISVSVLFFILLPSVSAEEFEATLTWSKRVELSTPVSGVVQSVLSQEGLVVSKGQVLIQLDTRGFEADLKYAHAQVKYNNENYQEAKRELGRQTDMYDRSMLSEHDLQIAKNNFTAAQAQFNQAKSSLIKAKLNLEYSAIRAPFDAVVIKTSAIKGQVVAASMRPPVLVVVAEANKMLARFYVTENKLNDLTLSQGAEVIIAGNKYKGEIYRISLEQEKSNAYAVDIIFDAKDVLLRAGQKTKVSL